jgi:hypothetical protein
MVFNVPSLWLASPCEIPVATTGPPATLRFVGQSCAPPCKPTPGGVRDYGKARLEGNPTKQASRAPKPHPKSHGRDKLRPAPLERTYRQIRATSRYAARNSAKARK